MKVKLGVTEYDLKMFSNEEMDDYFDSEDGGKKLITGGFIHPIHNIIRINKDTPKQSRIQSFFHECVHGMFDELGRTELYEDEDLVNSLSKQIYGLYKFNNLDKICLFLEDKKSGRN